MKVAIVVIAVTYSLIHAICALAATSHCELVHEAYGTPIKVCQKWQVKNRQEKAREQVEGSLFKGPQPTCSTMVEAGAYHSLQACEAAKTQQQARNTLNHQMEQSLF